MDGNAGGRGGGPDFGQTIARPGGAIGRHVRVLDADQSDGRLVVIRGRERPGDVGRAERTVAIGDGVELDLGVAGRRPLS